MLLELLDGKIKIVEEAYDWQEAIKICAAPLIKDGSIENRYIDAMIRMCQEHNAYIVLGDRFAMPHASPDCGVHKMAVTLTIMKKPVDFMGKPVQIVLTLAPIDNQSHASLLEEVATIFGREDKTEELIHSKDEKEILAILEKSLKETI